jgi:hypothetical protein
MMKVDGGVEEERSVSSGCAQRRVCEERGGAGGQSSYRWRIQGPEISLGIVKRQRPLSLAQFTSALKWYRHPQRSHQR